MKWTRHYEPKMGIQVDIGLMSLENAEITDRKLAFDEVICGLAIKNPGGFYGDWVFHDPFSKLCKVFKSERERALHELCHHRFMHLEPSVYKMLTYEEMEKEVEGCIKSYWDK